MANSAAKIHLRANLREAARIGHLQRRDARFHWPARLLPFRKATLRNAASLFDRVANLRDRGITDAQ